MSDFILKWPTVFHTVDCIIHETSTNLYLLGRKKNNIKFQFIGGFTDPNSSSDEEDVSREVYEETGLNYDIMDFDYIGNYNILDERYINTEHCIRTHLYKLERDKLENFNALDDIYELKLFKLEEIENNIVDKHKILLNAYKENLYINSYD